MHGGFCDPEGDMRVQECNPEACPGKCFYRFHILVLYLFFILFECKLFRQLYDELSILVIHCEWDEWVIGACSAECGVGTRTNTRVKLVEELNGGTCTGQPEEIEECMDVECPGEKFSDPCIIENVYP